LHRREGVSERFGHTALENLGSLIRIKAELLQKRYPSRDDSEGDAKHDNTFQCSEIGSLKSRGVGTVSGCHGRA